MNGPELRKKAELDPLQDAKDYLGLMDSMGKNGVWYKRLEALIAHCEKEPSLEDALSLANDAVDMLASQPGDRMHSRMVILDVIKAARNLTVRDAYKGITVVKLVKALERIRRFKRRSLFDHHDNTVKYYNQIQDIAQNALKECGLEES